MYGERTIAEPEEKYNWQKPAKWVLHSSNTSKSDEGRVQNIDLNYLR